MSEWDSQQAIEDLHAIARALGIIDCAKPYSAHEYVVRDIIPAVEALRAGVIPEGVLEHLNLQHSLIERLLRRASGRVQRSA